MTAPITLVAADLGAPLLAVHGGAGPSPSIAGFAQRQAFLAELVAREFATARASEYTPAAIREMVVRANEAMENDERFNAGFGSKLQSDGKVRTSAALMDGSRSRLAAVYTVPGCLHPSRLADALLEGEWRSLDGEGALAFMRELGMAPQDLVVPYRIEELQRKQAGKVADATGTVGAVAVDRGGGTWALTSTGGAGNETVGRISDTPTPAGNYATPAVAISATGRGEQILDLAVCPRIATRVADGLPLADAVRKTLEECLAVFGLATQVGLIAVTPSGQFVAAHTTPAMTFAAMGPRESAVARHPTDA